MASFFRRIGAFGYTWRKEITIFAVSYSIPYTMIRPVTCTGPSMHPTLDREKCYLLVRVGILFYPFNLHKGEVILSKNPRDQDDKDVVKRIIGMENDQIIKHPRGWKSNSPYLLSQQTIKKDHVWLQGDNMSESCDSRTYDQVPINNVYGKVMCQLYPEFKIIKNTLKYGGQGEQYQNILKSKSDKDKIEIVNVSLKK
eukprot:355602_1